MTDEREKRQFDADLRQAARDIERVDELHKSVFLVDCRRLLYISRVLQEQLAGP